MKKAEVNMLSGSIVKGLLTIAIPIMIMNVVQSLFGIIDMIILKNYDTGGGIAVGAVGASSMLISLMQGLLIGISAGANVVIARYIGQGDEEHVEKAVGTSILISLVGGLLLLLIGVSFADTFLKLTNCPERLFSEAVLYFQKEEVDIVIGNHPNHNCTIEKRDYMVKNQGTNPFINKEAWGIFLKALEDRRMDFERKGWA